MAITVVTPLPSISRASPTFKAETNNFFSTLLPAFTVQSNQQALDIAAVGVQVTADKAAAAASVTAADVQVGLAATQVTYATAQANAAALSAADAASAAGAQIWYSGVTYAAGAVAWSPVNRRVYRRSNTGSGLVDPSIDTANWAIVGLNAAVAVAASNLDCSLGDFFTKTVAGNTTFTVSNVPASPVRFGLILRITHTSGVLTMPTGTIWSEGIAPTFTTGKVHLIFLLTEDGGTKWRGAALANYAS